MRTTESLPETDTSRGRLRGRPADQRGIAMVTVTIAMLIVFLAVMVLARESVAQYEEARYEEREDVLLAHMESVVDRYVSKVQIDAGYHYIWVDEFERTRTCTDPNAGTNYNQSVAGGNAWFQNCGTWEYVTPTATDTWQRHQLTEDEDDGEVLIEVQPVAGRGFLELSVVGRIIKRNQFRALEVEITPPAVSEFQWISEIDLRFTTGANVDGPIYSGNDVYFSGPTVGTANGDVYADNLIVSAPNFAGGSEGFDTSGSHNDIRAAFPEPLIFDDFWDDIDLIRNTACLRGGACLNQANATAYLVHPTYTAGVPGLAVWYSTATNQNSCLERDEWWWTNSQDASNSWTSMGSVAFPPNGVIWANATVVLGNRSMPGTIGPATIGDPLTIVAGDAASPADIVVAGDLVYGDGGQADVLGLVASGDIVLDPTLAGQSTIGHFTLRGAMLAMEGEMRASRSCGRWGALSNTSSPTLNLVGSSATRSTGDLSTQFVNRNYSHDPRFSSLAPPFFPRIAPSFAFVDWREVPIPDWGKS